MTPTPEQIEKAGYWFNKNIRARKTVEQLSTAYVLAAYAAHCVAETLAEKDAEIARLRDALKPFTYMHDPDVEGDPLEGLPDGHGFIITSTLNEDGFGCGACNITAGQIRRARAALQETKL